MEDKLEPIAIIGMSCRFPGDADSIDGFWEVLSKRRSAWSEVPKDRFNAEAYFHPSSDRQGAIIAKGAHFLKEDVGLFDAPFFSMTASEAAGMDPQQRLLLEVAYESFENAGISIKNISGSQTSCHVGCFTKDYELTSSRDINQSSMYTATGCGYAMLANRLSWFYDLRGPSLMVDTACSSSLVALHLACQELRTGQSKLSLVAGTNLMLQPEIWRGLSALRFISPDGVCHSFDSRANGYGRGEGMGVLVLKPLSQALQDNDTIRAVIRGSAINQDGKTPGITVPSSEAQANLIRQTYGAAGLDFSRTGYFEAHGTGTPVGDPLELGAIGQSIGASRSPEQPLLVGSVKTNLGHLEGGAGVAAVIKTVLALEHGMIPAVVGFETPNPRIHLDQWRIKIPTQLTPWPDPGLRRASVNSFGYGGTNVHVIIDDALHYLKERKMTGIHNTLPSSSGTCTPASLSTDSGISLSSTPKEDFSDKDVPKLFVFSSPEQAGLARLAECHADFIGKKLAHEPEDFYDDLFSSTESSEISNIAYTLSERRTLFEWRSFAVGASMSDLQTTLDRGLPQLRRAINSPTCAFVFTGQGAQWFAMGRELQSHAVFRSSLAAADSYLKSLGSSWSVHDEINRNESESRINEAEISQPLCTVLQVAMVDLVSHWGLRPKAVVGHSSGEIGAAYAAGFLTQEDAWKIAYYRGVCSANIGILQPDLRGAMLAAALSESSALKYVEKVINGQLVVACINSPMSVTISGDESAVQQMEQFLKADNIWCRKLKVKTAYHSPHMKVIAKQYYDSIADVQPLEPSEPIATMFSSVSGAEISHTALRGDYWVENMVSPVRFSEAVASLLKPRDSKSRRKKLANVNALLEIGPHTALQGPLREILTGGFEGFEKSVSYMSLLYRGNNAVQTALEAAGRLWSMGFNLDLSLVNSIESTPSYPKAMINLPKYPWNHERRYWFESRSSKFRRTREHARTDLLGGPADDFNLIEPRWQNYLKPMEIPWVMDHRIQGLIIFPGAAMLVMVLEAAQQIADQTKVLEGYEFRDVNFVRALMFETPDTTVESILSIRPHIIGTRASTAPWLHFSLFTIDDGNVTTEHCNGLVRIKYQSKGSEFENGMEAAAEWNSYKEEYHKIQDLPIRELQVGGLYDKVNTLGLQFGPFFRNLTRIQSGDGIGRCELEVPDTASSMPENFEFPQPIHAVVLDGIMQFMVCTGTVEDVAMVPKSIRSLYISASVPKEVGAVLQGFSKSRRNGPREYIGSVVASDESWSEPKVIIEGFACADLAGSTAELMAGKSADSKKLCTRLDWKLDPSFLTSDTARILLREIEPLDPGLINHARTLDKMAVRHMRQTLGAIGTELASVKDDILARYINWMRHATEPWIPSTADQAREEDPLLFQAQSSEVGKRIDTIATKLEGILAGEIDLKGLFGDFDSFHHLAENTLGMPFINSALSVWIDKACYQNPDLEVLEIGSGSVSTVVSIMERLGGKSIGPTRLGRYVLTDQAQDALERANELLKDWPSVDLRVLNVEKDLESQGFEAAKYDFVIFNEILPTTLDIEAALKNVHRLLKPGGKLFLGAVTKIQIRTAFTLGLTSEWWRDHSKTGTLPDEDRWGRILQENGFTGIDFAIKDSEVDDVHQLSLMVSSPTPSQSFDFKDVILAEPRSPTSAIDSLSSNLLKHMTQWGLGFQKETWQTLPDVRNKVVIILLELDDLALKDMSETDFSTLKALALESAGVLWVTRGSQVNGTSLPCSGVVTGLFRSIRSEMPHLQVATLDLSEDLDLSSDHAVKLVSSVFRSIFAKQYGAKIDMEYAEAHGCVFVPRLIVEEGMNQVIAERDMPLKPEMAKLFQEDRPLRMAIGEIGLLDSFRFVDHEEFTKPLRSDHIEMRVLATGLNFVDVMAALGQVPTPTLGCEVAGVITKVGADVKDLSVGDTVVGMLQESFCSYVRIMATLVQRVPDHMTPEVAVSCVIAYLTAYFGLVEDAKISSGETVLIHSASGGVGQAAVQLCQHFGAEIFATVGSESKKKLLMDLYGISDDHIFNSRDTTFAKGVMRMTKGRGVDVVLNSVAGEALRQTWHCVADFGRFVEIGKRDLLGNSGLDMEPFLRGVRFIGLNIEQFNPKGPHHPRAAKVLQHIFELLRNRDIKELYPVTIFSYTKAEEAFRSLQSGKFAGKIVLRTTLDDVVPVLPRVLHPLSLDSNATYVLAGGFGGIGRSLVDMLQSNGARHFVFLSKSGSSSEKSKAVMEQLRRLGARAVAYACDISNQAHLKQTIDECAAKMPPIKGLIQCAMVLKDTLFENMTYDDWVTATKPKIQGSWNLHKVLPKDLDFFVMLSSVSGIIGNQGQANYAAGNTFQDALAHFRHRQGLRATALDLGAVRDIGHITENSNMYSQNKHLQAMMIGESDIHQLLKSAITGYTAGDQVMPSQITTGIIGGKVIQDLEKTSQWARDTKFSIIRKTGDSTLLTQSQDSTRETFMNAESLADAAAVVEETLVARLAKALVMSTDNISTSQPLHAYGVDSLIAVEIRNWIMKELQAEISVFDILSPTPISGLAMKTALASKFLPEKFRENTGDKGKNDDEDAKADGDAKSGAEVVQVGNVDEIVVLKSDFLVTVEEVVAVMG